MVFSPKSFPMNLLQRHRCRIERDREALRLRTRDRLRAALLRHAAGQGAWVYGSLCKPGRFNEHSDCDVALESLPEDVDLPDLQSLLSRATEMEVDVCLLGETRLADIIRKTGERWTT